MKATQAKAPKQEPIEKKPCYICKRPSHVWGYIKKGAAHVCSKDCYIEYSKTRYSHD